MLSNGNKSCEHWLFKGTCKYGDDCKNSHDETLVCMTISHPHPLGPDQASKRKKFFCDICQKKSRERYRCTVGCDFDVCMSCLKSVRTDPVHNDKDSTVYCT